MRVCRCLAVAAALFAAGPAFASPAAWSGHRTELRVIRHRIRVRPAPVVPVIPPPVLVWDYLTRNHNVPLYNQPPRSTAW